MKTFLIIIDVIGVVASLSGALSLFVSKDYQTASWAFAAGCWAMAALVKDMKNKY